MNHSQSRAAAFTLIELMISIAIVLILMLGINFVFGMTSRTISGGMALSQVGRDIRNSRKIYDADFGNMVSADEMPAMVIHSEYVYAWRDRTDKLADADLLPWTYDADGNAANGDEIDLSVNGAAGLPGIYNFRRHRVDRLSFFTRNSNADYARQTGDNATYVGPETGTEAWVSYGMLRLAGNNDITYWKPGARGIQSAGVYPDEKANQNNFFASQWILGRRLILLKDRDSFINTAAGAPAVYAYDGLFSVVTGQPAHDVHTANAGGAMTRENPPYAQPTRPWLVQESRIDLGANTIANIRTNVAGLAVGTNWFADADLTDTNVNRDSLDYTQTDQGTTAQPVSFNYLSWAKPFVNKQMFTNVVGTNSINAQTREAALTTPIFVRGCMQFIVEFAGDFYDQGPNLTTGEPEPIGTVDYDTVASNGGTKIHWYGRGRDIDEDGAMDVAPVAALPIPANGQRRFALNGTGDPAFEQFKPTSLQPTQAAIWAWGPTTSSGGPTVGKNGVAGFGGGAGYGFPATGNYNVRPSLIRVTMELIDSNGRLQDGQRIEFVYHVK